VNLTTYRTAIKTWVEAQGSGLTAQWRDAAGAWQGKAFARLHLGAGVDWIVWTQDEDLDPGVDMVPTVQGCREMTLSILVRSRNQDYTAMGYLEKIRSSIHKPSVKTALRTAGLAVATAEAITDLEGWSDDRTESVASLDVHLNMVENEEDALEVDGYVETASVGSNFVDEAEAEVEAVDIFGTLAEGGEEMTLDLGWTLPTHTIQGLRSTVPVVITGGWRAATLGTGAQTGTAGAGTSTTVMTKPTTAAAWTDLDMRGSAMFLRITGGGGMGAVRPIVANDGSSITVQAIAGMNDTSVFAISVVNTAYTFTDLTIQDNTTPITLDTCVIKKLTSRRNNSLTIQNCVFDLADADGSLDSDDDGALHITESILTHGWEA
jgi:hypothetical protein